jgi:DNA polymerase III epsilon subunit-like protein
MPRNILFIMCDQLRWDYLSCYGHLKLNTPNIDALAALNEINTEGHHRALADAVMTSKLLAVMRKDLMELYDNQAIDSLFLHGYQKKAKNSVRSCG